MMLSHGMIGASKKYTTLDPVNIGGGMALSNGNLTSTFATTVGGNVRSILGVSTGKRYYEFTATGVYPVVGVVTASAALSNTYPGLDAYGWGYYTNGNKYYSGTNAAFGATWTTGDIIGVELDMSTGSVTYYKNGALQGTAFTGLTGTLYAAAGDYTITGGCGTFNFGATPWNRTPNAGYIGWYS